VLGIIGPFPEWMIKEGRLVKNFFTKERLLYQDVRISIAQNGLIFNNSVFRLIKMAKRVNI